MKAATAYIIIDLSRLARKINRNCAIYESNIEISAKIGEWPFLSNITKSTTHNRSGYLSVFITFERRQVGVDTPVQKSRPQLPKVTEVINLLSTREKNFFSNRKKIEKYEKLFKN